MLLLSPLPFITWKEHIRFSSTDINDAFFKFKYLHSQTLDSNLEQRILLLAIFSRKTHNHLLQHNF